MAGFLIPPWYEHKAPDDTEMNLASLIWGVTLTVALFSASLGTRQTLKVWKRTRKLNAYVILVWIEWAASLIMSFITWFFLWGTVPPSFYFFFTIVTVWSLQVQCIIQIIINRIALLMRNKRRITWMKWICAAILTSINISVYTIWVPARLQISERYIAINEIWDRVEKGIFLLVDASLNIYFVYLVRSKLIANGLEKYNRLFRFNLIMIVCSTALDGVLIGVMSLKDGFIYLQFHPFVYLFKLQIELNATELIAKIVRTDEGDSGPTGSRSTGRKSQPTANTRGIRMATLITANREFAELQDSDLPKGGIRKTVETEIQYAKGDDDGGSQTSSTRELRTFYGV